MYEQIISWDNICGAYFDIVEKFAIKSSDRIYKSINGETLFDIDINSFEKLEEIQSELQNKEQLLPARKLSILKKAGGVRDIFIVPTKERIKCQAISRVLEPYFENKYSDSLHSYRSSNPSYYAGKSLRRLYLRKHKDNDLYVLKLDIKKYSDTIDHDLMKYVLKNNGVDLKTIELVDLYLKQNYITDSSVASFRVGAMQGMNLCPIFYNTYIGHIDKHLKRNVYFYKRIGDDLMLIDKNKKTLLKMKKYIENETKKFKLAINPDKTHFDEISKGFIFLGLEYKEGKIGIPNDSYVKIISELKRKFKYNPKTSISRKKRILSKKLQLKNNGESELIKTYIKSYNLVNDTNQIKRLSRHFIQILTKYFTGGLTYKKINKTKRILKDINLNTFTKQHLSLISK